MTHALNLRESTARLRTANVGTDSLKVKENPQLCQLCEEFASEALFYLKENETQTEIINTLHQACSKFPSRKLECTRLVDYYAPFVFTKIASLSPEEFCVSVSFCGEVTFIHLPRHEDTCTLCHEVVDEIVTNLEDLDMELKIIDILLKGCNNAENFVQKCKRLTIQNTPIILEHIKKFLKKRDFCNTILVFGGETTRSPTGCRYEATAYSQGSRLRTSRSTHGPRSKKESQMISLLPTGLIAKFIRRSDLRGKIIKLRPRLIRF